MSVVTQPLRVQGDILEKVCICTTWVERFLLNASVTLPSLCRVEIATTAMVFTLQQCVRSLQAVPWKFSTTKNLHSCFLSLLIMILRLYTIWLRCVPFGWVLSKAGGLSIIAKMLQVHRAGLKFICVVLCNGLTRCWLRWIQKEWIQQTHLIDLCNLICCSRKYPCINMNQVLV